MDTNNLLSKFKKILAEYKLNQTSIYIVPSVKEWSNNSKPQNHNNFLRKKFPHSQPVPTMQTHNPFFMIRKTEPNFPTKT